jgi:hypothetical protein
MTAFVGMTMAFAVSSTALACKCAVQPLTARLDAHPLVAVVRVDAVAVNPQWAVSLNSDALGPQEPLHVTYALVEALKGDIAQTKTLATGMGGGDCGVELRVGEDYLLIGEPVDGTLRWSTCSGSLPLGLRSLLPGSEHPPTRETLQLDAARAYLRDKTPVPACLDDPDGENCEAWFAERGL